MSYDPTYVPDEEPKPRIGTGRTRAGSTPKVNRAARKRKLKQQRESRKANR